MRAKLMVVMGLVGAVTACDKFGGSGAETPQVDPSQLTSSSGEVSLSDGGSMSFNITSERYKQWDAARRAFPKALITRFGQVLQPRSPSERSINQAVALLEGNAQAKQAIERAGLNVRAFVEITVALEQQMMLASTRGERPAPMPSYETYPMTMDSGYYAPPVQPYPPVTPAQPYPPVTPVPAYPTPTPYPAPAPSPVLPPPRDTVRRDTIVPLPTPIPSPAPQPVPVPPPSPRPDTMPRRDTMPARRDTAVAPRPVPRDTSSDTLRVAPPDSTRRR